MPLYFITEEVTREGMMSCKEAPERAKGVVGFAAKFNVSVLEFHFCMAHFDFIMKVEAPDDESASAFAMAVRRTGNVSAQVTRAFTPEEWAGIVARLPD
ncbi:MAG: GYD domain-containing protein [Albidovulum sp.]|nr:GYD domain-containing protein [Albidovulum sp.]